MNDYIGFFNQKEIELKANSSYEAKLKAVAHFKPSKAKRHMVHVMLVAVDGKQVTHVG